MRTDYIRLSLSSEEAFNEDSEALISPKSACDVFDEVHYVSYGEHMIDTQKLTVGDEIGTGTVCAMYSHAESECVWGYIRDQGGAVIHYEIVAPYTKVGLLSNVAY